jgi:hypothetical protein
MTVECGRADKLFDQVYNQVVERICSQVFDPVHARRCKHICAGVYNQVYDWDYENDVAQLMRCVFDQVLDQSKGTL